MARSPEKLALGLMSGTSADGVTVALAAFKNNSFRVLAHHTDAYSDKLFKKIMGAIDLRTPQLSELGFEVGGHHAAAVIKFLRREKLNPGRISVIGSHGQTVYHGPEDSTPNTLQIGEPALIAEKTGITVVSDFRQCDIAAGGQGAPLIPEFDRVFFGGGPVRALQNIGGIANVCVVGKKITKPIAFDNGPGNCLMDEAVRALTKGRELYDANGERARRGKIDYEAVLQMAKHPFFLRKPPKSTGRELFNAAFIPARLRSKFKGQTQSGGVDLLATLNYFTAYAIAESYRRFIPSRYHLSEVIVSGGGALNPVLMSHLRRLLWPVLVTPIDRYGLSSQAKEPVAFAYFGLCAVEGRVNHLPASTGASGPRILGKITPGRNFKGVKGIK